MENQKPLLNKEKENMPDSAEIMGGPEFEPAPGWGYKVNQWLKKYFNKAILPGIAVLILILGINNYLANSTDREPFELNEVGTTGIVKYNDDEGVEGVEPVDTVQPINEVIKTDSGTVVEIVQSAERGEGITHLARKSLKKYQKLNPELNLKPEQKIYVEDYLQNKVGTQGLEIGDTIKFSTYDMEVAINEALALSDAQIQNLSKYVSQVNF